MTERDEAPDLSEEAKPPLEFKLHGVTYRAAGVCPGGVVLDLGDLDENDKSPMAGTKIAVKFLDSVLYPEDAVKFAANMRIGENAITLGEVESSFQYLLGKYVKGTDRPTEAPSGSSDGAAATGQNSKGPSSSTGDSELESVI